jgi:SAM-dependent methyltransferase
MKKYFEVPMTKTIEYYNANSKAFINNTIEADMSPAQQRFLTYLHAGARILDLGCGSGRDSKVFLDKGYQVEPVDGSAAMCEATFALTGKPARQTVFSELDYNQEFDAVWASASLLHVPSLEIELVLKKSDKP